jgi:hypothetical protein
LISWHLLAIVLMPESVGRARRPMTSGQAAWITLVNLAFIAVLILIATGRLQ